MKLSKERLVEELELIEGDLLTAYLMCPMAMNGSKTSDKVKLSKDTRVTFIQWVKQRLKMI